MPSKDLRQPPKSAPTPIAEAIPLPPPEDEKVLISRAGIQAEQLIALTNDGAPIYLFCRISSGHTFQSDFFRIQFMTFARVEGAKWHPLNEEAGDWMTTRNCLQVCVDHPSRSVVFGPHSGFSLSPELANLGLSSYAYAQAITWLQQRYPDYRVQPSALPQPHSDDNEGRSRRNSNLAAHGFDIEWDDSRQISGRFQKEKIRQLIDAWDTDKVTEVSLNALLSTLARNDEDRAQLQNKLHTLQSQERSLESALRKEKQTNLLLTGITCFVLIFSLLGALGFY